MRYGLNLSRIFLKKILGWLVVLRESRFSVCVGILQRQVVICLIYHNKLICLKKRIVNKLSFVRTRGQVEKVPSTYLHWIIPLSGTPSPKLKIWKSKGAFVNPLKMLSDYHRSDLWRRRKKNSPWHYKKGLNVIEGGDARARLLSLGYCDKGSFECQSVSNQSNLGVTVAASC